MTTTTRPISADLAPARPPRGRAPASVLPSTPSVVTTPTDAPIGASAAAGVRATALVAAGCALALAVALAWSAPVAAARPAADADLVRLMRAMAAIKGALLVGALGALHWRFRRPVHAGYAAGYGAFAMLAAASIGLMWHLVALGTATVVLHGAGVALIALACRDPQFLPPARAAR